MLQGDGGSFEACAQSDGSPGFCCKVDDAPEGPAAPRVLEGVTSSVVLGGIGGRSLDAADERGLNEAVRFDPSSSALRFTFTFCSSSVQVARSTADGLQFSSDVSSFFKQASSNLLPSHYLHHQQVRALDVEFLDKWSLKISLF